MISSQAKRRFASTAHASIATLLLAVSGCHSNFKVQDLQTPGERDEDKAGIPVVGWQVAWVQRAITYKKVDPDSDADCSREDDAEITVEALPVGLGYEVTFRPSWIAKGDFSIELNDNGTLKALTLNSDPQFAENLGAVTNLVTALKPAAPAAAFVPPKDCEIATTGIVRFAPFTFDKDKLPEWQTPPALPE